MLYIDLKKKSDTKSLANNLYKTLSRYDAISLDIFDTTIIRLTHTPQDIFALADEKARNLGIRDFLSKRRQCAVSAKFQFGEKTNIRDIYNLMNEEWRLPPEKLAELMALEIDTETENSFINATVLDIIHIAERQGKEIFFISDMYLTSDILKNMLNKLGVKGEFRVISSCDVGETKRSGELFTYVVNEFELHNKKLLHIGDDLRSDVFMARCHTCFSSIYMPRLQCDVCDKIKYYGSSLFWSKEKRWSFQSIAPMLWCFCAWLERKAVELDMDKLFFLTREGAFFYKLFNIFTEYRYKTDILYASRRSIMGASADINWERMYSYFKNANLRFLQEVYGLEPSRVENIALKYNINVSDRLDEHDAGIVRDVLETLKEDIIQASEVQKEYLLQYLKTLGIDKRNGIIDIGWKGTSQACLQNIYDSIGGDEKFIGLYLGEFSDSQNKCEKYGYLCASDNTKRKLDVLNAGFIFENVLSLAVGSTLRYEKYQNGIRPVLEEDMRSHNESIKRAHDGILAFFTMISRVRDHVCIDEEYAVNNMFDTFRKPSLSEAKVIGDIQYMDANCVKYIARPQGIIHYLRYPRDLIGDIHYCGWNTGFCRRLFKLKLPYFPLYKFLKRTK